MAIEKPPLRALIIEDDPDFAEVILRLLREVYELRAVIVETEPEVCAALECEPWDLIISDHRLPAFDSFRVLEILHERSIVTPLILVSGVITDKNVAEAFAHGARAFLRKDDALTYLIPVVRRELKTVELRDGLLELQKGKEQNKQTLIEDLRSFLPPNTSG